QDAGVEVPATRRPLLSGFTRDSVFASSNVDLSRIELEGARPAWAWPQGREAGREATGEMTPRKSETRLLCFFRISDLETAMAHKKGQGSSRNGRESHSQRLGVKIYGGQTVKAGGIIVR